MASIQKRPDGRYRARYRGPDGKEHAKHFARKVDAQRWLDEQTAAMVTGQYVDPRAGRVIFRQCAEQWRITAPHGPAMRDKVQRTLNRHIYPTFGDLPVRAIRPSAVQSWVAGLPLAAASTKVTLGYLSAVFRTAVRDRIIVSNPCDGISVPPARRRQVWIPDLAAVQVLREQLPERYCAVVDLVIGSGMRQGEVFGLEVEHLDFLRGKVVDVRQQLVCLSPHPPYLDEVKSEAGERTIPLAGCTLDALAAHLSAFPPVGVEIEDRCDPRKSVTRTARLVFATGASGPMTRSQWSQIWRLAAKAAGFPARTGLHALRHFYASALIRHGESVKIVQKRLGHSSAAITLDTYTHLWPDSDDRTRQAVERALSVKIDRTADTVRTRGRLS
ncbi:MAG: site-specific integrase [Pseudonocardiales bacterium]|nr:site-specific integrase [Pseudonocardiales bacterium]